MVKVDIEELINIYHDEPKLRGFTCKSFKDRVKKHNAFTEVAEEFSTTVEEIQRKIQT